MSVYQGMNDTHDMTEHDAAVTPAPLHVTGTSPEENPTAAADTKPMAAPGNNAAAIAVAATPKKNRLAGFDTFVAKVRDASPAWLVNNGSRYCLGFKGSADILSVWSSIATGRKSPWRLAASLTTLGSEGLGLIYPEKDISDEQRASYRQMSPGQFVIAKTKEALNPRDYITESAGLALIVNGLFMSKSGINQSVFEKALVNGKFKRNISPEIWQGMFTSVAGMVMTYWPDRERAWQISHTLFNVRTIPSAFQADRAFRFGVPEKNIKPGDWQQWGKLGLNTVANVLGTFYGGIKKLPDGEIVHIGMKGDDVTAPRQSRRPVAGHDVVVDDASVNELKKSLPNVRSHEKTQPTTTISHAVVDDKHAAQVQAVGL
jgi:hypothetical protein